MNDRKIFSLLEVTRSVQRTVADRYQTPVWIKAEMNKLNRYAQSGHCFPELLEKESGKVVALMKATLWNNDYERINARFLSVLHEPLKDGIQLLMLALISFDPVYGLSLRIIDIDPSFSLGELEREKQETISRLINEGIYQQNKSLTLALLPQRIAVISVESSKGYADYLKIIESNPWKYKFFNHLFPALLQGDQSAPSIIRQLKRIRKAQHHFDAVAIIRGGGSDVGLSSFNGYALAKEIALFPLPVFTGIGHSTNETVTELVAYRNAIAPTELGDFLLQAFHDFAFPLKEAQQVITTTSRRILRDEKSSLKNTVRVFKSVAKNQVQQNESDIQHLATALVREAKFIHRRHLNDTLQLENQLVIQAGKAIQTATGVLSETINDLQTGYHSSVEKEAEQLDTLQRTVSLMDPVNILKRGFSITTHNGKLITNASQLNRSDVLVTRLANGLVESRVEEIKINTNEER